MHGLILAALVVSLVAWAYLLFLHGRFWRADQRLDAATLAMPGDPPAICAIVPARDEAEVIGRAVRSLFAQDYGGTLQVIVVDDQSADGTAAIAREAAEGCGAADLFDFVAGAPVPEGWAGKVWALSQGVARVREIAPDARYLWFTDADIEHGPAALRALVAKAEAERLGLVSLMARLRCEGGWERLLIPAFVFFFQKLYPFPWVNDPRRRTAAAAGGCMLVRRTTLAGAGGIDAVKDALIDDCALARALKERGPIWLGLATTTRSIRAYAGLGGVWDMVARSAYAQLRHSALLLAATVAGMFVVYLGPPLAAVAGAVAGEAVSAGLGLAAWALMAAAYTPTLRLYRQPPSAGVLLPFTALLYTLMTLDSALRHWRGEGGMWKGRTYTPTARSSDPADTR